MLRKWHEGHNKGMEFRAFIKNGKLFGLSQKDDTASYDFLLNEALKATIFGKVNDFIATKGLPGYRAAWLELYVQPCDETFVFDLYVDIAPKHRVFLQDVSPWIEQTSSSLFEWDELNVDSVNEPEFRTLSADSTMRRPKNYDIRFPVELNNMAELQRIIDN